ncbi:BA75_03139T0 [Komagataella pastoris]|uniref:BA75_03139T0 n=1 Tax=Komagataella pastoris TaxID=4922 RepID=A0A1B2JC95_PICPA|nr:BA75_03139T0 [Komagataella pastoris]
MDLEETLSNHLTNLLFRSSSQNPSLIVAQPSECSFPASRLVQWLSKRKFPSLSTLALLSLSYYIIAPSIPFLNREPGRMFKKRPDKTTTGLINATVDCFANSTVQALASLPALNVYLNEILSTQGSLCKLLEDRRANEELKGRKTFGQSLPSTPLHEALSILLSQLQQTIYERRSISVWSFLNVLEKIFNSRISKSQHDAHELLQLILETLEKEYVSVQLFVGVNDELLQGTPVSIPEFPFSSLSINQLRSVECGGSSSLGFDHMAIYSLPTPRQPSISLLDLIQKNQKEVIEGYNCVKCNVLFCIDALSKSSNLTPVEQENLKQLKKLNATLKINDDLPPSLQVIVDQTCKRYKSELKSTLIKNHGLAKPPKILPIHLSRSMFIQSQAVRNSCKIEFDETLVLDINGSILEEAQKFIDKKLKEAIQKAKECKPLDNSFNETLPPNLLFTEDEKPVGVEETMFVENAGQDSEDESLSSNEHIESSNTDIEPEDLESSAKVEPETSIRQCTYRLQAVICHQGSHRIGHYECYRRKPHYYKTSTPNEFLSDVPELLFKAPTEEADVPPSEISLSDLAPGFEESDQEIPSDAAKSPETSGSRFRRRMSSIISMSKSSEDSSPARSSDHQSKSVRRKLVSSSVKNPFWKISDSKITEYKLEDVLRDSGAAYMLFYELLP